MPQVWFRDRLGLAASICGVLISKYFYLYNTSSVAIALELIKAIKGRRSIREYKDTPVPQEIIEAAT